MDGQLIGTHRFRYAIHPHAGGWLQANVWRQAWSHNVPMGLVQTETHMGDLPLSKSFFGIEKPEVVLSALKKAERSDELVARVFNFSDSAINRCAVSISDATNVRLTDLNEDAIGEPLRADETISLDIGARKIVTLAAEPVRLKTAIQDSTEPFILQGSQQ
ncbi:MAG: glycosyl hydrolase-related protein [Armatimonadota bacterium]